MILIGVAIIALTIIKLGMCWNNQSKFDFWINTPKENHETFYGANDENWKYAPSSLDSMNQDIVDSAKKHLIEWVGQDFYSKLNYDGGQIINSDFEPYPMYNLWFSFQDTSKGINKYTTTLSMTSDGCLDHNIDLPKLVDYPEKSKIIGLKDAYNIAIDKTIDKGEIEMVDLDYVAQVLSIVWIFTFETDKGNDDGYLHVVVIDAHSGNVLDQHKSIIYKDGMKESKDDFFDLINETRYEDK